jgi:hypothetical protein
MKKRAVLLILFACITLSSINAADQGTIQLTILASDDCTLDFKEGWNLFSFCSELTNPDLINILSPIIGKYLFVMEWDDITKEFNIYSTQSTDIPPFDIFNDDKSYFIYVTENLTLDVLGSESSSGETRDLIYGWSAPSYPYRQGISISTLTQGIEDDILFIMKWNEINKLFDIYSFLSTDTPPFTHLEKGEGMFIYNDEINQNNIQITYP